MKSSEQVHADLQAVLDNHKQYKTLKELVAALCLAKGITQRDLAQSIGIGCTNIDTALKFTPYPTAQAICEQNPFDFSRDDGMDKVAEQILLSKTEQKRLWSDRLMDASRQAITLEVNDKVERLRIGQLSEEDLPDFQTALRALYPAKRFSTAEIHAAVVETEDRRVAAGLEPLLSAEGKEKLTPDRIRSFFSNQKPLPEERALLLEAAGVSEEQASAFSALASGNHKRQTAFTQTLQTMLERYGTDATGKINLSALSRFTQGNAIDPDGEGVSVPTLSNLRSGKITPTEHTVRLLAQAFTVKATGKAAKCAEDVLPDVVAFIESAGLTPAQLFQTSHQIIAEATVDMPLFKLLRRLRLAIDTNRTIEDFIADTGVNPIQYCNWENQKFFPKGDAVLEFSEQMIGKLDSFLPRREDGEPDRLSEAEKDKIRSIARHTQEHQTIRRDEISKSKAEKIVTTQRIYREHGISTGSRK